MPDLFIDIASKQLQAARNARELNAALMIETFFPDAFEHGKCRTFVVGNAWKPKDLIFRIERGDGTRRELPAIEVPVSLWRASLTKLADTPRLDASIRRYYERLLSND